MKRVVILALICINLGLIMVLAFHSSAEPAHAQFRRGAGEYTMISARRGSNQDVMFIVDNNSNLMFGFYADTSRREIQMIPMAPRNLARDFPATPR